MKIAENAGTPLYATAFLGNTRFVVAGGGGQGAHGVANKAIVYDLFHSKLEKTAEYKFPEKSDSPTSMASGNDEKYLWIGANVPASGAANGITHLNKLEVSEDGQDCKLVSSYNHFKYNDIAIYQKTTSVAGNFVVSASSAPQGRVAVFSSSDEDLVTLDFKEELVGAAIADYDDNAQKFVAVASESVIDIRTISKPNAQSHTLHVPKGEKWSRIESIGPSRFIAASTIGNRQGAKLTAIEIVNSAGESDEEPTTIRSSTIQIPGFKSVTALATSGSRVAVASPGGDVYIYDYSSVSGARLIRKFKGAHKFPVTALAISPDGGAAVSTSLDGSLVLQTGLNGAGIFGATIAWVLLSAIIIAIVAFALNYRVHNYEQHNLLNVNLEKIPGFRRGPAVHGGASMHFTSKYHDTNAESIFGSPSTAEPTLESFVESPVTPTDYATSTVYVTELPADSVSEPAAEPYAVDDNISSDIVFDTDIVSNGATETAGTPFTDDTVSGVRGTAPSPTDELPESEAETLQASATPETQFINTDPQPPADADEESSRPSSSSNHEEL